MKLWLLALLPLATSDVACDTCGETQWGYGFGAFDHYDHISAVLTTDKAIAYDPSGLPINPRMIDRLTDEVEACLGVSIERRSFVVKVAADWVPSCDGTQQLLPVLAGSAGCVAKGLTPTEQCPCRWRAGIECPNRIIVTPSFFLYKDALIRFVMGTQNPWADPRLAVCATPTTDPLSDGSQP